MRVRDVTFQLDDFSWSDGRLEVLGRWEGLASRRLRSAKLTVTVDGRLVRLLPLDTPTQETEDGRWSAAFSWPRSARAITAAELEVGRNLVVALPLPATGRFHRQSNLPEATVARQGDSAEAELDALWTLVERLRAELAERENRHIAELRRLEEELPDADAIAQLADERDRALADVDRLEREAAENELRTAARQELHAEQVEALERSAEEAQRLSEELAEVRRAADEAEEARRHADADSQALREELEGARRAVLHAEEAREQANAELRMLSDELATATRAAAEAEEAHRRTNAELQAVREELDSIHAAAAHADRTLGEREAILHSLQEELQAARAEGRAAAEAAAALEREREAGDSLTRRLAEASASLADEQREVARLREQLGTWPTEGWEPFPRDPAGAGSTTEYGDDAAVLVGGEGGDRSASTSAQPSDKRRVLLTPNQTPASRAWIWRALAMLIVIAELVALVILLRGGI